APSESEISSWLFMGGNTRVRILNHDNNETIIILKEGYDISFISNEIEFRRSIEHFLVPTIHDIGKRFIVESLHPGVPINRLKYSAIKKYRLKAFSVFLRDIVFPRREYSKEYYDSLVGDVIRLLKIYIKQGPRTNLHIDFLEGACNIEDSAMIISTSHGDFQDANIILAEEGLKIIDWEAVDRRSITYDFITLFAQTRVSFPSVDQLQDLIEGQLFNSFFGEYEVQNNRETYLIVFLLEELLYQLRYSLLTSRGIQEENLKIDKLLSYLNGGFQRVA
ncbi:MAG: hypothetical protein OEQ53_00440, partial [Saprospiraceae bacterium]|nr:hypothetical protein [Saprospiraceae bacterium]